MPINRKALANLRALLGESDTKEIEANATLADRIERIWKKKLDKLLAQVAERIIEATARAGGKLTIPEDLEEILGAFFLEHEVATVHAASTTTKHPHIDHVRAARKKVVGQITPPGAKGSKINWGESGKNKRGETVYSYGQSVYNAGVSVNAERIARSYGRTGGGTFIEFINKDTGESFWFESAGGVRALPGRPDTVAKISTGKKPAPRTAKAAREEWDEYKKSGKLPPHAEKKAGRVKTLYIQKLQDLWKRNTQDFVEGNARLPNGDWNPDAFDKEKARREIQTATKVSKSRARTIVETETTRYYNDARREFYDEIETVEGYLFAIVRDSATTKWCLSRGAKGGLVFFKGSALLEKNTPPCHWNCRSELLPLSRLNPTHKRLLNDEDRWAKNNKLVPLPPGWNA